MSLIPSEFLERFPPPVRRAFAHIRNAFAVLGVLLLIVAFSIYSRGNDMTRDMDARARRALGNLVFQVHDGDMAGAMVIRAPLASGVDRAAAEKAIRRRAKEIDLEVHQTQSYSFPGNENEAKRTVTVMRFCGKKTLEALLALRPELGALLPCTIVLVGEPDGQDWTATLNLELLLYGGQARDAALETKLLLLKDRLLDVMAAAAAVPGNPSPDT